MSRLHFPPAGRALVAASFWAAALCTPAFAATPLP